MTTNSPSSNKRKAYKGIAMEGIIAWQYNRIQKNSIAQYKSWAKLVEDNTAPSSSARAFFVFMTPEILSLIKGIKVTVPVLSDTP